MGSIAMKIGDLAKQTGVSVRTLHYYEEIGLLSPSHRTETGYRLYAEDDIIRLQQIVSLRQIGFSLAQIRQCLEEVPVFTTSSRATAASATQGANSTATTAPMTDSMRSPCACNRWQQSPFRSLSNSLRQQP